MGLFDKIFGKKKAAEPILGGKHAEEVVKAMTEKLSSAYHEDPKAKAVLEKRGYDPKKTYTPAELSIFFTYYSTYVTTDASHKRAGKKHTKYATGGA